MRQLIILLIIIIYKKKYIIFKLIYYYSKLKLKYTIKSFNNLLVFLFYGDWISSVSLFWCYYTVFVISKGLLCHSIVYFDCDDDDDDDCEFAFWEDFLNLTELKEKKGKCDLWYIYEKKNTFDLVITIVTIKSCHM